MVEKQEFNTKQDEIMKEPLLKENRELKDSSNEQILSQKQDYGTMNPELKEAGSFQALGNTLQSGDFNRREEGDALKSSSGDSNWKQQQQQGDEFTQVLQIPEQKVEGFQHFHGKDSRERSSSSDKRPDNLLKISESGKDPKEASRINFGNDSSSLNENLNPDLKFNEPGEIKDKDQFNKQKEFNSDAGGSDNLKDFQKRSGDLKMQDINKQERFQDADLSKSDFESNSDSNKQGLFNVDSKQTKIEPKETNQQ